MTDSSKEKGADPERRGKRSRISVLVLGLGLSSVLLLWVTHRISERPVREDVPITHAVADLRVAVATSHLWLEEYLGGDETVDLMREVWGELDRAAHLSRALLEGGDAGEGRKIRVPLTKPALRQRVGHIESLLKSFRSRAMLRVSQRKSAGIGTDLDAQYDRFFRLLLGEAVLLEEAIEDRMLANQRHARLLFGGIFVAWVGVVTLAVAGLVIRERQRRMAEEALHEAEAQLRQAQKLDAVGRLAGGIAHDINNYLGAIANQCTLIKILRPEDEEITSNAEAALDTVGKTSSLIQRLLAFGRKQPVRREVVSLNLIVEDLRPLMERLVRERVELEVRLADEPGNVEIDPSQVEQVVVNLLVNAQEALPEGGRITVETSTAVLGPGDLGEGEGAAPGEYAVLTVSDEGEGIEESIRDKIFEPFFTTKLERGSSGLGLSTVYGIVRQSGGFLRLDSEVGRGTAFQIFLPRSDKEMSIPELQVRALRKTKRRRILLVEDNEPFRRSITAMLEALGHRVVTATDGLAALDSYRRSPVEFDLVITDILMPGLSGKEVARRLRREDPRLPLIFISGFTDRVAVEDLLAQPWVEFLAKPFSVEDLQQAMMEVVVERAPTALTS